MKLKPFKIPAQSEAEITRAIRYLLKSQGIWHFKLHQGLGSTPGIPDICGIWKGRALFIEIKTTKGKLSDKQEQKINEINRAGGLAFVARGIDDVIHGLGIQDRFLFSKQEVK
jgi:hypothetical protein